MAVGPDLPALAPAAGRGNGPAGAARPHRPGAIASTDADFRAASANLSVRPDTPEADNSVDVLKRHCGLAGATATLSSEVERTVVTGDPFTHDGAAMIEVLTGLQAGDEVVTK